MLKQIYENNSLEWRAANVKFAYVTMIGGWSELQQAFRRR